MQKNLLSSRWNLRVGIKRGTWNGMERRNGIWNGTSNGKNLDLTVQLEPWHRAHFYRVAQRSLICVLQCSPQRLAVGHVPLAQAHRVPTTESSS